MKTQFLTALLLTTSIATFTENCSAASPAERLAELKRKAEARQEEVNAKTVAIEASARSIESDRQQISQDTDALTGNLDKIDAETDNLVGIATKGETAIAKHEADLTDIKDQTAEMAAKAKAIADALDATILAKTAALTEAIKAGDADITARQDELRELTTVHTIITGQVDDLTGAVDTISKILNPAE